MAHTTASAKSFEASLEELEALVQELESGELGLEDALTRFERGVAVSKQCHQALDNARLRIDGLNESLHSHQAGGDANAKTD
jgi:exodeoxyribonuclease VII small subunit